MYYVYILRTSSNTLYTGQTNNLERRLKSAKYIRYFSFFDLVYFEKCKSRKEAIQREVHIKKLTKTKKEELILTSQKK